MINVYAVSFSAYCPDDDDKVVFMIRELANWSCNAGYFVLTCAANN